jgi:hypothetical protein
MNEITEKIAQHLIYIIVDETTDTRSLCKFTCRSYE